MFKPRDAKGYYHVTHEVPVRNYSTTATPPGGRVMHCGSGIVDGDKGEYTADEGSRARGGPGGVGASVTFTEHLEIPMEWVFRVPDDG